MLHSARAPASMGTSPQLEGVTLGWMMGQNMAEKLTFFGSLKRQMGTYV